MPHPFALALHARPCEPPPTMNMRSTLQSPDLHCKFFHGKTYMTMEVNP